MSYNARQRMMDNPHMNMLSHFRDFGLFRNVMLAITAGLIILGPFNDGVTYLSGWRFFTSVVAPAMMVIIVFLLLLDITMARVFAKDAAPARSVTLRRASNTEALALLVLALAWSPFVLRMLGISFGE